MQLANALPHNTRVRALSPERRQSLSFDAARWSRGDLVTGVATLVLLIALFLPWFSVQFAGFSIPGLSVDALSAHGWMYITLLVTLAVIGYLVARAVYDDLRLPVPRWQALAGATGIALLLSFIAFVDVPTGLGRSYGAFIGLLSTITAVVSCTGPLRGTGRCCRTCGGASNCQMLRLRSCQPRR